MAAQKKRPLAPPNTHILALAGLLAMCGCAGYHFGNQGLYPTEIETIHIPVFQSSSFRRDLGEELTEAVIKEVEKRTPYRVVPDADADSVLLGRITNNTKRLLMETRRGDSREEEYDLVVSVRWVNRRGDVIRQGPPLKVPGEAVDKNAVDINSASHFTPEYGQSTASAQLTAIQQLARRIVDLMETPW